MATKTYIRKFYPGSFVAETSDKEVPNRNYPEKVEKGCYGFRFFDITEVEEDGETLRGQGKNFSPMHYVGGTKHDIESIKKMDFNSRILQSNMRNNGWDYVVETRLGNFQPFDEGDLILEISEEEDGIYIKQEEENPFESD